MSAAAAYRTPPLASSPTPPVLDKAVYFILCAHCSDPHYLLLVAGLMEIETKSASRCITERAKGTHVFEIVGYSLKKGLGVGKFVRSIERSQLEQERSGYIKDDCLTIECVLTVIKKSQVVKTKGNSEIRVSSPKLITEFGQVVGREGSRRDFQRWGRDFCAHKIILAARSPVLDAELYGEMEERNAQCIMVEDMLPAAFKALLHFIYTDSLPDVDDIGDDDYNEMIRQLLVAADRYAIDRLKLICQSILGKKLSIQTVATTLALADHHNCDRLKDVCIEFISSMDEMNALMAAPGFTNLKRTCPFVLIDVLEKASRLRRA